MACGDFAASAANLQQTAAEPRRNPGLSISEAANQQRQSRKFTIKPAMKRTFCFFGLETIDANVAYSVKNAIFKSAPFARCECRETQDHLNVICQRAAAGDSLGTVFLTREAEEGAMRRMVEGYASVGEDIRPRATVAPENELAEVALWQALRKGRLAGLRFRRQHPIGPYILDFYCASAGLGIEVDGFAHDTAAQARHDERREAWLAGAWRDALAGPRGRGAAGRGLGRGSACHRGSRQCPLRRAPRATSPLSGGGT